MYKIWVLSLLFVLFGLQLAQACVCQEVLFEDRIERSDFIFVGRVLSVEDVYTDTSRSWPDRQQITLAVRKKYKGNDNDTLVVDSYLSSCSSHFETDQSYLVFANHKTDTTTALTPRFLEENHIIVTGHCTGTRSLDRAGSYLDLLDAFFPSHSSPREVSAERLYGEIWEDGLFRHFSQDPTFPGGQDSLDAFARRHLAPCPVPKGPRRNDYIDSLGLDSLYAEAERQPPAIVMVHFQVSKRGELSEFEVNEVFSLNEECNREALRVTKLMPRWNPAQIRGVPVRASYYIAVDFDSLAAY